MSEATFHSIVTWPSVEKDVQFSFSVLKTVKIVLENSNLAYSELHQAILIDYKSKELLEVNFITWIIRICVR